MSTIPTLKPARIATIQPKTGESFNVGIYLPTAADLAADRAATTEAKRVAVRLGLIRWWRYQILTPHGYSRVPFSRDALNKLIRADASIEKQLLAAVRPFFEGARGGILARRPGVISAKSPGFVFRAQPATVRAADIVQHSPPIRIRGIEIR